MNGVIDVALERGASEPRERKARGAAVLNGTPSPSSVRQWQGVPNGTAHQCAGALLFLEISEAASQLGASPERHQEKSMKSAPTRQSKVCLYCGLPSGVTSHGNVGECVDALRRSRGLFAGVSLEGTSLRPDDDALRRSTDIRSRRRAERDEVLFSE